MESTELVKQTSNHIKMAEWYFNAMNVMDELLDNNTRQKVREDCACRFRAKRDKLCKKINENYDTIEEKLKVANETGKTFGHGIKITGKGKYEVISFDESDREGKCVCAKPFRMLDKKWSNTWCYCCGGWAKYHLEILLDKKIKVNIISSALTSDKGKCHFELIEI
jgi:hypothetical protein